MRCLSCLKSSKQVPTPREFSFVGQRRLRVSDHLFGVARQKFLFWKANKDFARPNFWIQSAVAAPLWANSWGKSSHLAKAPLALLVKLLRFWWSCIFWIHKTSKGINFEWFFNCPRFSRELTISNIEVQLQAPAPCWTHSRPIKNIINWHISSVLRNPRCSAAQFDLPDQASSCSVVSSLTWSIGNGGHQSACEGTQSQSSAVPLFP